MKLTEILVFGATGQIGRNLIRKLTQKNYKVIAVTRNIHQKGYILKTQSNPGYLEIVEIKNFEISNLDKLFQRSQICINLIGILYENKKQNFNKIHSDLPNLLSKLSKKHNHKQFIHVSSLGIDKVDDSLYARSKIEGEKNIRSNLDNYVILKPSIIYSVDDNFTTNFMNLLSLLPAMPLYYDGKTKFCPIHVSDLVDIISHVINNNSLEITIECIGPEILTFKEMLVKILKSINKKRLLIPMPFAIAKLSTKFLQILPKPLITFDQLKLLKYDNIPSKINKTNFDLGLKATKIFENEIQKYSYNWTSGGQFSRKKNN